MFILKESDKGDKGEMVKMAEAVKVPEGWEKISLEKDVILISGLRPKGGASEDGGIPSLGGEHITTDGRINFTDQNAKYIPEKFYRLMKKGKAKEYDILINKDGANTGKVAILKEKFCPEIAINEHLFIIRSRNFFEQKYLFYWFLSNFGQKQIKNKITGSAQPGLSSSFTKNFFVLKPPLPEQRKIAEILETVDNAIEKTDKIIEKYKRIKQGLMQELLTKGITAFKFEKDKLISAVKKALNNRDHEFGREENLVSHLSTYLRELFKNWDVDSEVEKNEQRERPDIIIHKRNTNKNLFAIEVKKSNNLTEIKRDIEKLEKLMLDNYKYEDVVFIGFNITDFNKIFELSNRINFILVSKDGKIKVKEKIRKFKDSPLGRIPEEWEVVELGEVADVKRGASPRPIDDPIYFSEVGRAWIRILDVTTSNKYLKKTTQYLSPIGEQKSVKVEPNELIMSICATIGKPIIVKIPACIHDGFVALKNLSSQVDIEYLFYYLSFNEKNIQEMGQIGTQRNLNSNLVSCFKLLLPPLPEQKRIASILSQIDEVIEKEQKYKEKLERIKRGLMEDLLTGKVRVNCLIKESTIRI